MTTELLIERNKQSQHAQCIDLSPSPCVHRPTRANKCSIVTCIGFQGTVAMDGLSYFGALGQKKCVYVPCGLQVPIKHSAHSTLCTWQPHYMAREQPVLLCYKTVQGFVLISLCSFD